MKFEYLKLQDLLSHLDREGEIHCLLSPKIKRFLVALEMLIKGV